MGGTCHVSVCSALMVKLLIFWFANRNLSSASDAASDTTLLTPQLQPLQIPFSLISRLLKFGTERLVF